MALLLLGVLAPGAAAPAAGQSPSDRYGIVNDNIVTLHTATALMRDAGFGWVRYNLNWNLVNPADGVYDWSNPDREIGYAKAAGLKIYLTVTTPPTWATGASYPNEEAILYCFRNPSHPDCQPLSGKIPTKAAFETFATALVSRYVNDVDAWGFGSEVHDTAFWTGTPAQFVERILVPGYVIVKQIAGSGAVVAGPDEDVADSLATLLQLEATYGRFCDVVAFHILGQSTPNLAQRLAELKAVVDAWGQGRVVWLTELGFPASESDCLLEGFQAEWLRTAVARIDAEAWITRVFIYRIANGDPSAVGFGLLNTIGTSRTAWHVMKNLITGEQPTAYLAEGAAGGFFDLDIAIANPTCATATAKVTFLRESGAPLEQSISLPPRTRSTIHADDTLTPGSAGTVSASTVVQSTNGVPLVVERTMFWDATYYAGHTGSAVTSPARTWYFGEGSQGFFDTYVLLANSSASAANVTVRFLRESGGPVNKTFVVAPNSRQTIWAGSYPAELTGTSFSIVVDSDVPIIAERAMYFGTTPFWSAGHESAGVSALAKTWYHAEGATGSFFDTFILVGNPNDQIATVSFTYLLDSGQVVTKTKSIGPQSRLTVYVNDDDPQLADVAVSTTVSSDVPVVSERAMYWAAPYTGWYEAHNSFGVTETGLRWVLAEGRVGTPVGFETYILLANPTATAASVRVTFLRGLGQAVACTFTVPATSRFNVHANGLNTACEASGTGARLLADEAFGALVESVNGVPIFAERAIYWNAGGVVWAGGTNATATLLP